MTDNTASTNPDANAVDKLCAKAGQPEKRAEQYIVYCLTHEPPRLPNMAGFFRWMKLSATARDHFKSEHPEKYRTIKMIFEDEALNSPLPPSIVSAYMKQYFSGEEPIGKGESGGITLVFEHDINRDGE